MTKIIDCDLLDNRRIITSGLLLKRGDIRFCPYEVSFCLARLPRVEGVLKPSEMAAFAYPAKASNLGLTTFGSFLMRGQSSGLTGGNAPRSILGD